MISGKNAEIRLFDTLSNCPFAFILFVKYIGSAISACSYYDSLSEECAKHGCVETDWWLLAKWSLVSFTKSVDAWHEVINTKVVKIACRYIVMENVQNDYGRRGLLSFNS